MTNLDFEKVMNIFETEPCAYEVDYSELVIQDIVAKFRKLSNRGKGERKRQCEPEYSWKYSEVQRILSLCRDLTREVVAKPCEFKDGICICWQIQFAE